MPWNAPRNSSMPVDMVYLQATACSRLREAIGIGGRVAAFETNLMRTQPVEFDEALRIGLQAVPRTDVKLRQPSTDALRIELLVPRRIERVRHVHAPAVAADLDHLRSAVQRNIRARRMRRAPHDPAKPDR